MDITNNRGAITMENNDNIGFLEKFGMRGADRVVEGEKVIDANSGLVSLSQKGIKNKEERRVLILTPTRVILYHNKGFIGGHSSIDFPLSKINNVVLDTGMLLADIKIHSGDDIITMRKVSKPIAERFAKNLKTLVSNVNNPTITIQNSPTPQAPTSPQAPPTPQTPNIDIADQIRKLADLKAQGFLTEEEFTAQKKKLLGL
jgi:hypothetical protein